MIYEVLLSEGGELIKKTVPEVVGIISQDNSYRLYDKSGDVLFIAPQDSVIYISLA